MTKIERIVGMGIKYGAIIIAVLFAGFRLAEAVQENTEQSRASVIALEGLSVRVTSLEDWRSDQKAFDLGYKAAMKAVGEK